VRSVQQVGGRWSRSCCKVACGNTRVPRLVPLTLLPANAPGPALSSARSPASCEHARALCNLRKVGYHPASGVRKCIRAQLKTTARRPARDILQTPQTTPFALRGRRTPARFAGAREGSMRVVASATRRRLRPRRALKHLGPWRNRPARRGPAAGLFRGAEAAQICDPPRGPAASRGTLRRPQAGCCVGASLPLASRARGSQAADTARQQLVAAPPQVAPATYSTRSHPAQCLAATSATRTGPAP
jgi:hypothetical protein